MKRKSRAREILGVPEDSILNHDLRLSLQIPPPGRDPDFLKTCQEILEAVPEAYLLAAGVIEDDRWRDASNKLGSRLRALGSLPQSKIAILHQASDVYVEGFPFGSTTALLEADCKDFRPCSRRRECFRRLTGQTALRWTTHLERPASMAQGHKLEVIRLCKIRPSEPPSL